MKHPCIRALKICLENCFQGGAIGILTDFIGFRERMLAVDTRAFSAKELIEHSQSLAEMRETLKVAIGCCQYAAKDIQDDIKNHVFLTGSEEEAMEAILKANDEERDELLLLLTCGASRFVD